MTDDLITWLRAQLDKDERVARTASPGPWEPNAEHDEVVAVDGITVADGFALSGNQLRATVDHIARWDPARALAEIDAKRRIIDRYEDALARQQDPDHSQVAAHIQASEYEDWVLPALALPYADREGYQEGWRP